MITFLLALDLVLFPQYSRSHIKIVFHEFIKCPTIPELKSKQYACKNMSGVMNILGSFQYYQLENNHPLGVPRSSSYTAEIHWEGCSKYFPTFPDGAL